MVGWHPPFSEHEFEQTPEDGEGQGSLACCSSQGCTESDTTERLNNGNIGKIEHVALGGQCWEAGPAIWVRGALSDLSSGWPLPLQADGRVSPPAPSPTAALTGAPLLTRLRWNKMEQDHRFSKSHHPGGEDTGDKPP